MPPATRRPAGPRTKTPAAPAAGFRHRNLPLLLLQARERVMAQFRPMLNTHGLTEQQWRIIRALLEAGALEPRQIVSRCGISSPSLAGVLARMEELDLVQRERMAHDQRRQHVSLTPHSRSLAAQLAPQVEATYTALEAQLGPDVVSALYGLLDQVISKLDGDEADEP